MQQAASNRIIGYLVLGIVAIFCSGCIVPSQQAVRTGDAPHESTTALKSGPSMKPQGLIKPTIPEERRHAEQPGMQPLPATEPPSDALPSPTEQPEPDIPPQPSVRVQEEPESIPPDPTPQPRPKSTEGPLYAPPSSRAPRLVPQSGAGPQQDKLDWEDQKIKEAATELARSFPRVTKIKVCYAVKDDEWWVTLYDNAGAFTELKQYTWNRDLEKLEVFLVLKRIPSSRVPQQMTEEEVGKACEILEVPKVGSNQ